MTDFAHAHVADWRDGQMPRTTGKGQTATVYVSYDTRHRAYNIAPEDRAEFEEWVADLWEIDRAPRDDGETASDYLDRIGCTIREL